MEILSITTSVSRYGGAQKVMLDLHNGLKEKFDCKILSLQAYSEVHPKYGISPNEFIRLKNPMQLKDKILLVHARNLLPFFVALKTLLFLNTRIIYVSHNVYSTYRRLTFFPKEIVSISNKVTENLVHYFRLPKHRISLIYNGMEDFGTRDSNHVYGKDGKIKILYPARVNKVKRQVEIVRTLKGRLDDNIVIHFAGVGEDLEVLEKICTDEQFKVLGFVENIHDLIKEYDFIMLFSTQEGLPLSLIEGIMHGKPVLVNDVGGNLEIGVPSYNGILLEDNFQKLSRQLNDLSKMSKDKYSEMSKNSRTLYLRNFQYSNMIDAYKNLIENVKK